MPKLVNALLVQSKDDWFWAEALDSIGSIGRQEDTLALSGLTTADATRVAQQYLALTSGSRLSISAQLEPLAADLPYRDFQNGDTVTVDLLGVGFNVPMVVAETDYTIDDEGWANPVPVLNSQQVNDWAKFQSWLKANQAGIGGQATATSVVQPTFTNVVNGKVPSADLTPFSFSGLVTTGKATPMQSPDQDTRLTVLTLKAPPADTAAGHQGYVGTGSNSVYTLFRKTKGSGGAGTMIGAGGGTWPDGAHPGWIVVTPTTYEINIYVTNEFITPNEEMWAVCLTAGGHTDVSIKASGAPAL